jgi:hypothetical protein
LDPNNTPTTEQVIENCNKRRGDLLTNRLLRNEDGSLNLSAAIKELAEIRELRTGIKIHEIPAENGLPAIRIRDARACKKPYERGYESYEMSMLNALSTAFDIIDSGELARGKEIKEQLNQLAIDFIEENNDLSQITPSLNSEQKAEASKRLERKIKEVALVLKQNGVKKPFKDLNEGKDYQNFNYEQAEIVTIAELEFNLGSDKKKETVIEAEVGLRGLYEDQKNEYQKIINAKNTRNYNDVPEWFKVLSKNEKRFVEKYAEKIIQGKHVHPTQLRRIAGIKNAFEKITAIYEDDKVNELHGSLHAGTLGSVSKDKGASEKIAQQNFNQAKKFVDQKHILHPNTFNTKALPLPLAAIRNDNKFIKLTKSSSEPSKKPKDPRKFYTNTAFNAFRRSPGSSQYGGVELLFEDIRTYALNIEI